MSGQLTGEGRRVGLAVNRIIDISIPYHLSAIQTHQRNIDKYRRSEDTNILLKQQINGLQSVQRLKSDLRELEALGQQLPESDHQMVCQQILAIKATVDEVVQQFIESNNDLTNPLAGVQSSDGLNGDLNQSPDSDVSPNGQMDSNLQLMADIDDKKSVFNAWQTLSKELGDLNDMFNTIVSTIRGQRERVNSIESNINSAQHDVLIGTQHLSKASALRSTTVALTAGLLSGAVFGPIGMLAGFKFSGVAAALGAGIISYSGVKMIQKKSITSQDIDLIENKDNKSETEKKNE